mmetsp:Transcript_27339/g.66360  ORF Transcript_27339/g.66360 Transcript_27339/m.66360 type:complete len:1027 (+) Transcript_27339:268-3348(+)|eukprot:CAMPEP_0113621232 /NCGR_PEP_ID=MMETSP0017_2-20120614/10843_1 /TAXON_ID=2856 /ORGANISM="Cylindrotheca closterium" /LENGTH=1026 /DNA_ID=CAMNT_0000530959 /DNA_START=179 /DNA_END=3262 /DNA_ORIENTATION=+ /assembly_acc=CAM_ASM_000147
MVHNMLARSPMGKPKVLLLGISYPSVEKQMEEHGFEQDLLIHKEASVDRAVECVRRGILTEMDARDLARCVATEQACDVDCYSSSREIGAVYRDDRHVYGDFNNRNFCKTLKKAFGEDIQFSQVILDYYWMPSGWLVTRWAKTLFQQTLPDLVKMNMLTYPSSRSRNRKNFEEGVVYLPFCAHVCKELVGGIDLLSQYYAISFVKKSELSGHSLWKGTMSIDGNTMQHVLGKRLDQEEVYCTFRKKDIFENMEDSHVSKPAVMRVLQAIEDYDNIRMIRLRPLRQHEPVSVMKVRLVEPEKGGFIGLNFNLAKEKQKKAELEAKRKKEEAKKEKLRIRREAERKQKQIARKAEVERQRKIQERRAKKAKELQEKKAKALKSRQDAKSKSGNVVSNVEEIPVEEKYATFFPGPAANIKAYDEPGVNVAVREQDLAPSYPPSRINSPPSFSTNLPYPDEYLLHNPRLAREDCDRPQQIDYDDYSNNILDVYFPSAPIDEDEEPPKKLQKKANHSYDGMDVRYLKGEQLERAKVAGYVGSAVQYVYIPEGTHEVDLACKLVGLRKCHGMQEVKSKVYHRKELTCFKVPSRRMKSPTELSPSEKILYERWKIRIARSAYGAASVQDGLLYLTRLERMDSILHWFKHNLNPLFDPMGYFARILPNLVELWGNEDMLEVAEALELHIHEEAMSKLDEESNKSEEWKALNASILKWLQNEIFVGTDEAEEFNAMKEKLAHDGFKSDASLASEMADRILFLRQIFDWKRHPAPDAPAAVETIPQQELPLSHSERDVLRENRKRPRDSGEREIDCVEKKLARKAIGTNTVPKQIERVTSKKISTIPNEVLKAADDCEKLQRQRGDSIGQRSPIMSRLMVTARLGKGRTHQRDEGHGEKFYTQACSKIGKHRALSLCKILIYLQNPEDSFVKENPGVRHIARLIPDHTPLVQKATMVEAIVHGLSEAHGKDWIHKSQSGGFGFLIYELLRDIESLQRIPDDAYEFKALMNGFLYEDYSQNRTATPEHCRARATAQG